MIFLSKKCKVLVDYGNHLDKIDKMKEKVCSAMVFAKDRFFNKLDKTGVMIII